jgi:Fic family protein
MRREDFVTQRFGSLEVDRLGNWPHAYFLPAALPEQLEVRTETVAAIARATLALGTLAGLGQLVHEPELLLGPSMAQEALSSSRIEGTQASLSDVLSAESEHEQINDVNLREVDNYLRAANRGVGLLAELPLTQRFICMLHEMLMEDVRGDEKSPGELRRSPVWIGSPDARPETAKFIPPHQSHLPDLLQDWERFVNSPSAMPVVVKCALMHYQFETIHPFLDGNGRIGRLLIGFLLVHDGVLRAPILHISGFFEQHRNEYYDRLQAVRERGEIDEWIQFFSLAVTERADESGARIRSLIEIRERYRAEIKGERSVALAGLVDVLFRNPVVTSQSLQRQLDVSQPTASILLRRAQERGWVRSAGRRGRGGRERWIASEVWAAVAGPRDAE